MRFFSEITTCSRPRLVRVACLHLLLYSLVIAAPPRPPQPASYTHGVLIRFEGMITPMREAYLKRKLAEAQRQGADLVVLEIDSPGGGVEQTMRIAEQLRHIDWARTVAYIPTQALSGAAIMALACEDIVMGPDAMLGDVGVIYGDARDQMIKYADEKFRTPVVRLIRDLAEAHGRPPALAEAMVDKDLVVYRVRNKATEKETFMSAAEIDASDDPENWIKLKKVLETDKESLKKFLTVNGRRAVELQLADRLAASREEVQQSYGLDQPLVIMQAGSIDNWIYLLNLPLVTGLLFVVGLVALYVELSAPGISVGGLISGFCFALFFWSRFLGGTADWLEVILFLAGIVFVAVELFVIPGFGVSGFLGVLLIFGSLIMASQDFVIPRTGQQISTLTTTLAVILGSSVVFVIVAVWLSRHFRQIPVFGRLVLSPPSLEEVRRHSAEMPHEGGKEEVKEGGSQPLASGFPCSVGDWGVADSPLRPAGKVRFGYDYVDVVTDGTFVDEGDQVKVIDISGNRVMVRKLDPS